MTKTKLHQMGYRKGADCYYKTRRIAVRPEAKATVQVKLFGSGKWYDVSAIEGSDVNYSRMLTGVKQLRDWERFAFCR